MTQRKPVGVSFETWIDRQIREGSERGEFTDVPGAGRPSAALDAPYDDLWWVKQLMQREQLEVLPPALRLRKQVQDQTARAIAAPTDEAALAIITALNEEIVAALRRPVDGPPIAVAPRDLEAFLEQRHAARAAAGLDAQEPVEAEAPEPAAVPEPPRSGHRRWLKRSR